MTESSFYAWLLSFPLVGSQAVKQFRNLLKQKNISWTECHWLNWLTKSEKDNLPANLLQILKIISQQNIKKEINHLRNVLGKKKIHYVAWFEKNYPETLLQCSKRPAVLFYRSQLYTELLTTNQWQHSVSVVGTRHYSRHGELATEQVVQDLTEVQVPIISGLALGIDAIAHRAAVQNGGLTVAVVAGSIDSGYPSRNQFLYEQIVKEGIVLAEFPPGRNDLDTRRMFPVRNRIIAGLGAATVVTEAPVGSGALLTANLAQSYGRDLFMVPSDIDRQTNQGAIQYLKSGSVGVVTSGKDILKHMCWLKKLRKLEHYHTRKKLKKMRQVFRNYNIAGMQKQPQPQKSVSRYLLSIEGINQKILPIIMKRLHQYDIITRDRRGEYRWSTDFKLAKVKEKKNE